MGSIRRAPRTNRWEARYRDPYGSQRTATFDRKSDALAFLAAVETDMQRGTWRDPDGGRVRFSDFVEQAFLPTRIGLELTSQVRDLSYLRTHILPVFGTRPIASIDYVDCQAWVNDLATRRAAATVVKAAQIMNRVMKLAVRSRVIAYNPMAEVERPRIEESEDVFLTAVQVERLADAMERVGPRYRALVWVGCYAGPRIGELAALRWDDVDLGTRTLTISRKVVEVSGHGMVEGGPKTKAGRRTVPLPLHVSQRSSSATVPDSPAIRSCSRPGRRPAPGQQPPPQGVGGCGAPCRPRPCADLPRHAAHRRLAVGRQRRLRSRDRQVRRPPFFLLHQGPLRAPVPRGGNRPRPAARRAHRLGEDDGRRCARGAPVTAPMPGPAATDGTLRPVPKRVLRLSSEEFVARVRAAGPATEDDVSITRDGRRLDSKEAVLAWLADVEAERAAGRPAEFDDG